MDQPKVIVLILSYNGKGLLDEAIESYLNNAYENFEVVVIDNGSTDGSEAYVKERWPEVFVLRTQKNLGYSGGFNFGLDYAFNQMQSDYVLITNNDVKVDKRVISELVKVAETDTKIGFVTGKVYYYNHPTILQTTGYELKDEKYWLFGHRGAQQKDMGQFNTIEELQFADDIFMLVRGDLYYRTRGYDVNFEFQSEQFDWQIRSKKENFKLFYTPHAKIWHKDSITIGKSSPFKVFYNTRNSYIVRLKHRDKEFIRSFSRWYLRKQVLKPFIKNFFNFRFHMALMVLRGYLSALSWGIRNKRIYF